MALSTRSIGLSLGADLCWPACYEEIIKELNLELQLGAETVRFAVERVVVEPFSLRQPCRYDLVIDRLTHWFSTSREWVKKAVIMDGLYVLNNPWAIQSMEKHTSYAAMMKLGLPIPETWMVPPKEQGDHEDTDTMLRRYGRHFDLGEVGESLGYPLYLKPYDGGAWVGVSRIENADELRARYEESGRRVMHLQRAVEPFDLFVRAIGVGPQSTMVRYNPAAPLHARYEVDFFFLNGEEWSLMNDTLMTINGFFGWEFNSCEALRKDGEFFPIDFANACPDFQVTSLHYYFPEMVKSMLRWTLFCAATRRKMQRSLDWEPFFEIADSGLSYRERLSAYARISHERMQTVEFESFCATHLPHIDEVVLAFFEGDRAREIVGEKVAALFPAHEVEAFTNHFWGLIQFWCHTERDRLGKNSSAEVDDSASTEDT